MTVAYIDGGCRGNPGLAAYGVYVEHEGRTVELKQVLAVPATNNMAEYCGLIAALRWARTHKVSPLLVRSDSQLVVYQMLGKYQVHDRKLVPLYVEAYHLSQAVGAVTFEWVRRERNTQADRLCNEALDAVERSVQLESKPTRFSNVPHFRGV